MSENYIDDEDEELITPKELLEKIEIAWSNEMNAPDILPYKEELIELMQGQLTHMDEGLEALDTSDFRRIVHKMELERIRYFINSYLRHRLQKIENYTRYFLNEEENRSQTEKRASESEMKFAQAYQDLMENHFKQLIFRHIPPQQDDPEKRIVRPNLMSHVFIKLNNPCGTLVNSNDEEVDLNEVDNIHMLPYQIISDLLVKGDVDLV